MIFLRFFQFLGADNTRIQISIVLTQLFCDRKKTYWNVGFSIKINKENDKQINLVT